MQRNVARENRLYLPIYWVLICKLMISTMRNEMIERWRIPMQVGDMKSATLRKTLNPEKIGNRLRAIRCAVGYPGRGNQKKFCDKYGLNSGLWSAWETGRRAIPIGPAAYLVEMIDGLTLDYVFLDRIRELPLDLRDRLAEALRRPDSF